MSIIVRSEQKIKSTTLEQNMEETEHLHESNSETISERKIIKSKEKNTYTYEMMRKVTIGIFTLVIWMVLIARTSTLVAMPILKLIAMDHCSINFTSTVDISSTVYSSSSKYIQRLSIIMIIIITVLQWPAHGYLFHYLYKFFAQEHPALCVWQHSYNWTSFICRNFCKGALVMLCLIAFVATSMLTILGDIMKLVTDETSLTCEYHLLNAYQITTYVYYATTFFTYILEVAERWLMVCFTALVGAMWHGGYENRRKLIQNGQPNSAEIQTQSNGVQQPPNENSGQNQTDITQCNAATLSQTTTDEINAYAEEFVMTVDNIKPVYKIFRSFFVFQWLVHVYLLFTQIVHLLHPWIKEGADGFQTNDMTSKFLFPGNCAAVFFYALALVIPYVCGLKMNSYRRRYIRKARLTQQQLLMYDRENKSIFTPRVPGTGLSISLESPGYMLGVVLTMFGLVGALLAM